MESAREPKRSPSRDAGTPSPSRVLVGFMVAAIASVALLAYWDSTRESAAALDDFAEEQATLAASVGSALRAHLALETAPASATGRAGDAERRVPLPLRAGVRDAERAGSRLVLLAPPPFDALIGTDGRAVESPRVLHALQTNARSLRLSRAEAAHLGLPARTAMVGLRRVDAGAGGLWGVATVATAERERDRERRAEWRLLLGVLLAAGLVVAFGGVALVKQRRQLALSRDLAIAAVQKERDERLVRADKLATMGALATGIAHEVSTPLSVIVGRAEQLRPRVEADPKATRAVASILDQAARIDGIVRGFLSLARGDAPRLEHVPPEGLARAALELVQHRFARAEVALTSEIAPQLPAVACEPRLIEQVLVNLMLNACDACERGGVVTLSVQVDGERVAFVVTDDGHGVAPDIVARILEPLFTTKPAGQGTGLGLTIANEIVKHHQGTLSIGARPPSAGSSRALARGTQASIALPAWSEPA